MASDDQWPPVSYSSASKGSTKFNGNRRLVKESQQETLKKLNEMFSTTLESEVILSVAQNCNWELQQSIEGLIELSEAVDNPPTWKDTSSHTETMSSTVVKSTDPLFRKIDSAIIAETDCLPYTEENTSTSRTPHDAQSLQKVEKPKRGITKNRMDSFCGNIAKLKSSSENVGSHVSDSSFGITQEEPDSSILPECDSFFDGEHHLGATGRVRFLPIVPTVVSYGDFPETPDSRTAKPATSSPKKNKNGNAPKSRYWNKKKMDDTDKSRSLEETKDEASSRQKVACFDSNVNVRKNESESLCGLKVQYRLSGMESSSDDDADVVIEDESSDYAPNLTSAIAKSVWQFLSPLTQTPPRRTRPEIHMINTPSPPRTPQRSVHDMTFARIKGIIIRGDPILVLLRGLPGSGKTTLARSIVRATIGGNPSLYIYSADDFFMTLGHGVYKFDPTRLSDAHASNQSRVLRAMREGRTPIIVDNTNVEAWEMRPYAAMAVKNGYLVEILEPNTPWARNPKELAVRNSHNVTRAKINERALRFECVTSGKELIEMYRLRHPFRKEIPKVASPTRTPTRDETRQERMDSCMADIKSNWDNHDRNTYVLTSHDIESMQNIDEAHNVRSIAHENSPASVEYSGRKCPQNLPSYADKVFNDYLHKLQDSDDESFEMLDSSGIENLSDIGKMLDIVRSLDSRGCAETAKRTVPETKENSAMKDSTAQQILGAIGSERKVNHAAAAANLGSSKKRLENSGNVLSQCWDFTLIHEGCKLHSEHGHYVSTSTTAKTFDGGIDTVDDEMSQENVGESRVTEKYVFAQAEAVIEEKTNSNEIPAEEVVDNYNNVPQVEALNHGNLIDLNDDIVLKMDEAIPETISTGEANIVNEDREDKTLCDSAALPIPHTVHDPQDGGVDAAPETSETPDKISEERKIGEVAETPSRTTLGTLFHVIKTSILGGFDESSTTIFEDAENDDDDDLQKFVSFEIDQSESGSGEKLGNEEDEAANQTDQTITSENEGGSMDLAAADSAKTDGLDETKEEIVTPATIVESQNPFRNKNETTIEDPSMNLPGVETLKSINKRKDEFSNSSTDNVNSISWKESPFPVDGTALPVVPVLEDDKTVLKIDAQTMTTLYDFNVAYVGGTSEPEYRELWGVNRSINEGTTGLRTTVNRSSKTMFDKSSMTGEADILAKAGSATDKEKDSTNRLDDLIEMFPHYPREYLKTLYQQQCNCNFDWVVDVLCLADVPNLTIENYEKKVTSPETSNDDESPANNVKLSKADNENLKQRSHSSSPRNRRNRAKDFRSFSLDCVEDFTGCEASFVNEDNNGGKNDDENDILDCFYAQALSETNLPGARNDLAEASASSATLGSRIERNDADNEEELELDFGREFINKLENAYGNPDFVLPDEFKPVIRIKKSMVEELYGLWIQSMNDQMNVLHAQLDERMAKDEAMARAMDREQTIKSKEPVVPNFDEIMNMEMALARYQNELKENVSRETPNDMASRLTRQMLYDLLPDIDKQVLSDILKAHGGNFKETCEIIEANIGRTINTTDTLRKQQSLLERVNEERKIRDVEENSESTRAPSIVVNSDIYISEKSEKTHYKDAIERGQDARMEAQRQVSLRIENYNKAAEAYRKGQPQVAAYYSQMVKLHSENIKAAHANAASEFLAAQMYTQCGEDTLDLHYLHVREALQALDVFLDFQQKKLNKSNRRLASLFIITGYGARSSNGLGRIKPAVSKRLMSKNIRFTEANLGCLKVTLNRRNGAFD